MKNTKKTNQPTNSSATEIKALSRVIFDDGDKERMELLSPMYFRPGFHNGELFATPYYFRIVINDYEGTIVCHLTNKEPNRGMVIDVEIGDPNNILNTAIAIYNAGLTMEAAIQIAIMIANNTIVDMSDKVKVFRWALTCIAHKYSNLLEEVEKNENTNSEEE